MTRIALQLKTLDGLDESLGEKLDRVGGTAFEGVQFAGLDGSDPASVRSRLDANALEPAGARADIDRLEDEYQTVTERYRDAGVERLILEPPSERPFDDPAAVSEFSARVSALVDRLADDGFAITYHNGTAEFDDVGDGVAFERFLSGVDERVSLELDVGRAAYAGTDPVELLRRHGHRSTAVHVTDAVPGAENTARVELGAGEVDVERVVGVAASFDVEWLVYDYDRTSDPTDSLRHGATMLPSVLNDSSSASRHSP